MTVHHNPLSNHWHRLTVYNAPGTALSNTTCFGWLHDDTWILDRPIDGEHQVPAHGQRRVTDRGPADAFVQLVEPDPVIEFTPDGWWRCGLAYGRDLEHAQLMENVAVRSLADHRRLRAHLQTTPARPALCGMVPTLYLPTDTDMSCTKTEGHPGDHVHAFPTEPDGGRGELRFTVGHPA